MKAEFVGLDKETLKRKSKKYKTLGEMKAFLDGVFYGVSALKVK